MKNKIGAPINGFLRGYSKSGTVRMHMPGHKGLCTFSGKKRRKIDSRFDITEIAGADSLYEADGVIKLSEHIASGIYNTRATVFSAGGSTLCIQAMLRLALSKGDTVVCARNAHAAFHNALALFDLRPHWIYPDCRDGEGVCGKISPDSVAEAIDETEKNGKKAKAVYITSPDYMGVMSDIESIALVCKKAGVMLLVDNAHGAHLAFTPENRHPIALGAALCCDSAHKTLPVLTGGAYLHSGCDFDERDLKRAMALVGSTSPSYLILNSLDCCNGYLSQRAKTDFARLCAQKERLVKAAEAAGLKVIDGSDCTKLSLLTCPAGYSAHRAAEWFRKRKIECEYASGGVIVFLMTPFNSGRDFKLLENAFGEFKPANEADFTPFKYEKVQTALSPHEALWAKTEEVPISRAAGRISAQACITCPPGVPITSYGELITESTAERLKKSGKSTAIVVK